MDKKKEMEKRIWILLIPVCYALMWLINYAANGVMTGYWQTGEVLLKNLLYLLVGAVVFAIPYEKLAESLRSGERALPVSEKGKTCLKAVVMLGLYAGVCFAACTGINYSFDRFRNTEIYEVFVTVAALLVLIGTVELISNRWLSVVIAVVVMFANAYTINEVGFHFIMGMIFVVAEYILYMVYCAMQKKFDWRVLLVSAGLCVGMFFHLTAVTVHWSRLDGMIKAPTGFVEREKLIPYIPYDAPTDQYYYTYGNYPLTTIKYALGNWALVVFGVLFFLLLAAVVQSVRFLAKQSPKRAAVVLGLYLLFAMLVLYTTVSELGMVTTSGAYFFHNRVNLVLLLFALRMFVIPRKKE